MKIHSIIDIITNSSTEIYTYYTERAVEITYKMINELYAAAGIDKKAEDIFEVSVTKNEEGGWDYYPEENDIHIKYKATGEKCDLFKHFWSMISQSAQYDG